MTLGASATAAGQTFNRLLPTITRVVARPIQRVTGILLVVIGVLLVTGRFAAVSASLADLGQWVDLKS